jgi:fatty acid desaturase
MEKHIKVARAHRAISWLYAVIILMFLGVSLFTQVPPPSSFVFVGLFIGGLFAAHHFTAKGAFKKKTWARNASQVIAVLMLFGFPVGTFIGIYLLSNSWGGWEDESY